MPLLAERNTLLRAVRIQPPGIDNIVKPVKSG